MKYILSYLSPLHSKLSIQACTSALQPLFWKKRDFRRSYERSQEFLSKEILESSIKNLLCWIWTYEAKSLQKAFKLSWIENKQQWKIRDNKTSKLTVTVLSRFHVIFSGHLQLLNFWPCVWICYYFSISSQNSNS